METSKLTANMKQKFGKQCVCQWKQFGYHGGRLFWSFPVCILFLNLIYKLSCILKQKLFWNEKKTNLRKMSKKTSKSFKSRHSFPSGCDIFQQEKAWSWHFPRSFNCDALAFFVEGEETIFLPKSWPSITSLQSSFYRGIPFDVGACSNIQSTPNTWCHKILLPRMGTAMFPKGFNPCQTVENQEQHRQHFLKSCLPFSPARMGLSLLSEVAKSSAAFKPSKKRNSILCFVWFHCLAA